MTNVFDHRVLTPDETDKLDKCVDICVTYLQQISDLRESMKETVQDCVRDLNDPIDDPDQKIKVSVVNKLARTKFKNDLDALRAKLAEIEDGLQLLG